MHAGLHSGRFQFFLVGESHRELLVTGPAATRTVEMEAASEAGEILLSPETAALLGDDVLGEEHDIGRLLRQRPTSGERWSRSPTSRASRSRSPCRRRSARSCSRWARSKASTGMRRSPSFDSGGRTRSSRPRARGRSRGARRLVRIVQAAAEAHDVTFLESDIDRDGGRIILVAGAPQTFGDDEERLLRTLRAIVDAGLPLPVHIGVSQGRVFAGQVGASFRRTYTMLGDTAALAARLMARAGEDEIWVSAEAFAREAAVRGDASSSRSR